MWRFARNPVKCEELVQDVFVEAYFGLPGFRTEAPFIHWLKRIAVCVGYRYWRKKSEPAPVPLMEADGAEVDDRENAPKAAARIVDTLLSRLDRKNRLVLTLYYFESKSVKTISEMTNWSISKVKMRLHRARQKLKSIAEQEGMAEELP